MRLIETSLCTIKELDLDAAAILASLEMYDPAISTILMGVGAEETIPLFEKANVTMKMFLLLTDDDLKNIGVQLSPTRKEILGGIKNFHLKEWSQESVPQMAGNAISFQEALTITMNTMKQLHVLSSSLKYVSDGLRENSPPVPVNKDVPVTAVLCKCIDAVIKSQEQLNLEMHALKEAVNQMHSSVDSVEADYIPPAAAAGETNRSLCFRVAATVTGLMLAISFFGYVSGTKIESILLMSARVATK